MKLLVCSSEYPPDYSSGIGNVAYNVVKQLKKMGVNCTVCSPNGDINLGSSKLIGISGILGLLYYWHQVSKYFKKKDFAIAWLHNPLLLKNNPFKNSLVTMNSTYYGDMIQRLNPKIYYKIASKIERYCLNKIDENARFTGVGTNVCEELEEIGISRQRIRYIPNGVNTERFKPFNNKKSLRKKFGIPEEDLIILSLGRLTDQKQPQKLIEVFSVIEKKIKDATLVIAGKGELLDKTKEFAKQKKIKNIRFLGYVDDTGIPDLYACSDLFIIASKYEGGEPPLTVAEAMASGLPCIVSDIPNLRFIEDIKAGIVVDFNDTEKAAVEIIGYLHRDNSEHSKNAREYAVNNLDWKIIAGMYLDEFEKIISTLGR
jgi:glycosyltransferase involved in cell wall biosynthesis